MSASMDHYQIARSEWTTRINGFIVFLSQFAGIPRSGEMEQSMGDVLQDFPVLLWSRVLLGAPAPQLDRQLSVPPPNF
jgi:hypothetical protein